MADDDPTVPTAPPDASRWLALDDGLWRRVVVHLRRSLADAPGADDGPQVRRLAAVPTPRLVAGRARRDAAGVLAAGGPVWNDLRRRVTADPDLAGELGRVLRAVAPPAQPPPAPPAPDAPEVDRLRERLRRAHAQRDDARRRAVGEAARADREAEARHEAEAALARAQEHAEGLARQVEEAAEQAEAATDRERRRGQAMLAEATEQLRRLRRQQQEQARRDRAAVRAEQSERARSARAASAAPARDRAPRLVPGRPSRLPDDVRASTTEAADLLLHAGRLVLVDGYNVTRTHRADLDLEGQRRWLLDLVAGAAATRRIEPRLVFDGHATDGPGSSRRQRGLVVVFTPAGVTADDDLVFEVEATDPARPVVVVTDDRGLRTRLAPYGVDLLATTGFLGALR